jgi:transglutaminase-like putative cysteine protease
MHQEFLRSFVVIFLVSAFGSRLFVQTALADIDPKIKQLIADGSYADAEKLLAAQIADASAPVTSDAAIQLEILRRTRQDFSLTADDVLKGIKEYIPDATAADIERWTKEGDLLHRAIDGKTLYFTRSVGNLFRFNSDAKRRMTNPLPAKKFDTTAHAAELVQLAATSSAPEIHPIKHRVHYEVAVKDGNPRLKPGAVVRAWLPFPQEYRQQRDVKLIRSKPASAVVSSADAPQRTVYFEHMVGDDKKPPTFMVEFDFVTSAYCPKLDPKDVKSYDTNSGLYREFTAERPPHIVFSPEVKKLTLEIVGDETNPLEKARRIFRWISGNIPWCAEMEYSIIPNLSAKGLAARRGDCGVQGISFITLCRAAGVPARWQSGWQTKPDDWNMHDWSEIYIEPWGWLPVDASYGVREHADPRVRDFYCGNMDGYRLIVNLDYARPLQPPKTSFRSEPNDFQRGEIEIDGHNLYFNEWEYKFQVETTPLAAAAKAIAPKQP